MRPRFRRRALTKAGDKEMVPGTFPGKVLPQFPPFWSCGWLWADIPIVNARALIAFQRIRPITQALHLLESRLGSRFLAHGLVAPMEASSSSSPSPAFSRWNPSENPLLHQQPGPSCPPRCLQCPQGQPGTHETLVTCTNGQDAPEPKLFPQPTCGEIPYSATRAYHLGVFELSSSCFGLCSLHGCL